MFPLISDTCQTEILPMIIDHLSTLEEKLYNYFPSLNTAQYDWIRNSFVETITEFNLTLTEEEKLAELSTDRGLMIKHKEISIEAFWISIKEEYVSLSKNALTILLQFSTSNLCELGFSSLATTKCKKRGTLLRIDDEMRFCLSNIRLNIEEITRNHQAHASH